MIILSINFPFSFFLVVDETENFKLNNSLESRCLAKVVLPLPEGAHKIITFPNIKEYLMIVLLIFQVKFSFQLHWIEYLNY